MADAKFDTLWTTLGQCPYELPEEIKPHLKAALASAGYNTPTATGAVTTVVRAKKKVNGYNLFMKEQSAKLKADNVPSDQRMKKVAELWKEVSDDDKKVWKAKADAMPAPAGVTTTVVATTGAAAGSSRALTGYQLYVRETMPTVKADTSIDSKSRMKEIGRLWKALDKTKQEEFNNRAKTATPTNATP